MINNNNLKSLYKDILKIRMVEEGISVDTLNKK